MPLRELLYRVYWSLERVIAPGVTNSQNHYARTLNQFVRSTVTWLDVGCGHQILPPWREEQERSLATACRCVVGIDYEFSSLRRHRTLRLKARALSGNLPFAADSFDLVTANMVVEHLAEPAQDFHEIGRVLKRGGIFLLHTPNARAYTTALTRRVPEGVKRRLVRFLEGRELEDVFPAFYRANTVSVIESLAAASGLCVEEARMVCTGASLAIIPPLALVELLWLRILTMEQFAPYRTNIIGILRKPLQG